MSARDDLIELEHSAWKALSCSGDAAAVFYEQVLAKSVVMLLAGGMVIDDRAQLIDSMRGTPWTTFELSNE